MPENIQPEITRRNLFAVAASGLAWLLGVRAEKPKLRIPEITLAMRKAHEQIMQKAFDGYRRVKARRKGPMAWLVTVTYDARFLSEQSAIYSTGASKPCES